ncbi:putative Zn-dependent protease [Chitinivorax tropicus]|uniref:Putative Zn-dependent protease n=1 Tax=Chitinivorax tropicus TaxID=714531 RepID=A0A840MFQ5_9PROT|nr:M48 family metalloprotease [Chitinivorax tropicus]MBB5018084.1 putative Zn-dependent protease [Chitinivorax tropicus]
MRSLTSLIVLACFSWQTVMADGLPDLGDSSQSTLSMQQERSIGESIMREIRASDEYLDDPDIMAYINSVGYKLAASSQDPTIPFEFFVVNDKSINAFAMPGGFIGIHAGIFLTAQSESELAGVIGHEIAHVTQHHLARRAEVQSKLSVPLLAAMALAILSARSTTNSDPGMGVLAATQALGASATLAYSRDHEREADRLGLQTLSKAGFDARAMPRFLERMQKAYSLLDNNALPYLRSHPLTTERVADTQSRVDLLPYRQIPDSTDFLLIREKLRVMQNGGKASVQYYDYALAEKKYTQEIAYRYGLAFALLKDRQYERAQLEINKARKRWQHPMLETLAGDIQLALNQPAKAGKIYQEALQHYPGNPGLSLGSIEALLRQDQAQSALDKINEQHSLTPGDARLYHLRARAYEALKDNAREHQALAEYFWLRGNPMETQTQLKIAMDNAKGNFYLQSALEARLREIRRILQQDKDQNKAKSDF